MFEASLNFSLHCKHCFVCHARVPMVSMEIVSLPTPKPAFCAGNELVTFGIFWALGVSSGCWKWGGVGSESKLGVRSEGLTNMLHRWLSNLLHTWPHGCKRKMFGDLQIWAPDCNQHATPLDHQLHWHHASIINLSKITARNPSAEPDLSPKENSSHRRRESLLCKKMQGFPQFLTSKYSNINFRKFSLKEQDRR